MAIAKLLGEAAAIILVIAFALTLGAQMFDTFVNVPVFFSDPPGSISDYLKFPIAHRVPAYFARLIVLTLVAGLIGWAVSLGVRPSAALDLSSLCAVVYVALIFLFFIPTNRKLGFLPAGAAASPAEPREMVRLARRWRMWNVVRICIQFAGLIAAVLAVSAR